MKILYNMLMWLFALLMAALYSFLIFVRADSSYLIALTLIIIGLLVCIRRMLCPPTQQIVREHRVIVQPNPVIQNPISYIVVQEPENHYSIGVSVTFVKNPLRETYTL
jgi:hypothetical protein